jgi:hypothetical protein
LPDSKVLFGFLGSGSLGRASRPGLRVHGHENPERRAAGKGFAFYGTTVIANDLGDQSKPQASSGRFRGDEGIVQIRQQFRRDAGAIVTDAKF